MQLPPDVDMDELDSEYGQDECKKSCLLLFRLLVLRGSSIVMDADEEFNIR